MSKEGFIKLHRALLDSPIFNSEPYTKGQAWVALLMLANHKEGYITVKNGKMIKIIRGECGYSELALSDIFKWSRGKVKRFLKLLESEKMVQQKIVENHSIIKILNFNKYQDSTTNNTTNDTTNDTTNGQQTDINNNDNNDNNEKNDKNNIGEEKKNSNPDFYFSSDKTKVFEIYENECKNLIPLTGEKRNRKVLDKTSNFLNEIEFDWDYFKNLCQKANELKTIANTKIDFEMLINCHIGIMNGKYHKDENKRGVSQEFIDNFFENLKKEEAQNE